MNDNLKAMPDSYWQDKLTPEQFRVLREKGTEAPHSGDLVDKNDAGVYSCAACGYELFSSDTKYDSTTPGLVGWPAFYAEAAEGRVELHDDNSFGMRRTEILCSNCGSHLGHLFDGDSAAPNGKHYCVNSVALKFDPKK